MRIAAEGGKLARSRRKREPGLTVSGESQRSGVGVEPEIPSAVAAAESDSARLIAAAPVLIWSAGLDRRNDWFSPSWSAYTGRNPDELLGDGWTRAIHPEDLDRCLGIRATSFEARAPFSMDLRVRRHDGQYRWMLDNGVPRIGTDGAAIGYVGSCVDIHERKELEESLAERTQQLRLAERRQGQFLAMLSHELRNPLAPIANAASVLRTLESSNPILVRLREILERQVARMGHLIEELIDVTRAAQGQISLVREQVSVESVVQAAVAAGHDKLTTAGHRLDIDLPDARLFVRGDRGRLAQALSHLIINAAKFTFEPSTISISVRRAARTVQIAVKDQGAGIDPKFLPHAFELFAQQDQTLARTLGGLGVGLTLARRIAQLHGGDVEGFSEGPGRGSEFVFWLPLIEPEAAADEIATRGAAPERDLPRPDRRGQRRHAGEPAPADGALGHGGPNRAQRRGSARDGGAVPTADRPLRHRPARHGRPSPRRAAAHDAGRDARRLRRGDRLCQRRGPAAGAGGRLRLVLRQAAQPRQPGQPAALVPACGPLSGRARRACLRPQRTSSRVPGSMLSGSPSSAAYSFRRL